MADFGTGGISPYEAFNMCMNGGGSGSKKKNKNTKPRNKTRKENPYKLPFLNYPAGALLKQDDMEDARRYGVIFKDDEKDY